ncbi:MAG: GlcNAc-transferase family protein [Pseudomonadota bacterium]
MNRQPKIFIAIAAYADPDLPRTLDSCLANAANPERLTFGICWQFDPDGKDLLGRFENDARFSFVKVPIAQSGGGCWARNQAQQLYDGEAYTLQIDSHMEMAPGWDESLVRMMAELPADKPIISMIAPLFRIDGDGWVSKTTELGVRSSRISHWDESGGWAPWFDWGKPVAKPHSFNRFLSGQFVFAPGFWCDEVRQDPDHYYWGEEFALSLRSFTHGYDIFLPDRIVAWHMEHRTAPPRRHWEKGTQIVSAKNKIALERLRMLAFSDDATDQESLGRYGLGGERSRTEYERFSGVDLKNKRAHPDVFVGRPPDPITIKSDRDWNDCVALTQSADDTNAIAKG